MLGLLLTRYVRHIEFFCAFAMFSDVCVTTAQQPTILRSAHQNRNCSKKDVSTETPATPAPAAGAPAAAGVPGPAAGPAEPGADPLPHQRAAVQVIRITLHMCPRNRPKLSCQTPDGTSKSYERQQFVANSAWKHVIKYVIGLTTEYFNVTCLFVFFCSGK